MIKHVFSIIAKFSLCNTIIVIKYLSLFSREKACSVNVWFSNSVGLVKDDKTLRELNVTPGAKMMVVGSTLGDVITVQAPSPEELKEEPQAEGQQQHHLIQWNLSIMDTSRGVPISEVILHAFLCSWDNRLEILIREGSSFQRPSIERFHSTCIIFSVPEPALNEIP